jgi:hypothetical protein
MSALLVWGHGVDTVSVGSYRENGDSTAIVELSCTHSSGDLVKHYMVMEDINYVVSKSE